jgi:hypothetical protein
MKQWAKKVQLKTKKFRRKDHLFTLEENKIPFIEVKHI